MRILENQKRASNLHDIVFLGGVLLFAASLTSCDNSFSPKAEYKEQLVVFSVLDNAEATHYVRLETTYDSEIGGEPIPINPKEITEATVTVTGDGRVISFRDTLLPDETGNSKHLWYTTQLHPREDMTYRLDVHARGFDPLFSHSTVPGKLYVRAQRVVSDTGSDVVRVEPGVTIFKNPPRGFLFRLWVIIKKNINGTFQEVRREVPSFFDSKNNIIVKPTPTSTKTAFFSASAINYTLKQLAAGDTTVREKQLLAVGYAMDNNFYSYYKVVRGFDDPVTVRIDNPNISFINGGLGVFGSILSDSIRYNYRYLVKE